VYPVTQTERFRQRLIDDARRAASAAHDEMARLRAAGQPFADQNLAFALAAMAALHAHDGDTQALTWLREDLLWIVDGGAGTDGLEPRAAFTWFRILQPFCEAYRHLRDGGHLSAAERGRVEAQLRVSGRTHVAFTDWGPHNRAVVDASCFLLLAGTLPDDALAPRWRAYGEALLADSWGRWSMEDASIYPPLWLTYLLTAAETLGRADELLGLVTTRYYVDYWLSLLTPTGMLPDYGDGDWTLSWEWYVPAVVCAAAHYRDGRYLWLAQRLWEAHADYAGVEEGDGTPLEGQPLEPMPLYCAALALRWLDTSVEPRAVERSTTHEALEDLVGKKVIFRSPRGSYALLNYRDEGPYARAARDYLNQQLAAYEEKPHHGHADEHALNLLMDDGAVLLHDGGYRIRIEPEGYRADVYHNRLVVRPGMPVEGDVYEYLERHRMYTHVETEKLHAETFGPLDYTRTRLVDPEGGYAAERIVIFVPSSGANVVVDFCRIDRAGHKTVANVWHLGSCAVEGGTLRRGNDWAVSWPPYVPIRDRRWRNPHTRDLLIRFLRTRGTPAIFKDTRRAFHPSVAMYQHASGWFTVGQRLVFITVLAPHPAGTFLEALLNGVRVVESGRGADAEHGTLALALEIDGQPATVGLKLDRTLGLANLSGRPMFDPDAGALQYGENGLITTDADMGFAIDRGATVEFGFVNAARFRYAGAALFEMPVHGGLFQGFVPPDQTARAPRDTMPRWHETVARPI
jgi:hypothetical protein